MNKIIKIKLTDIKIINVLNEKEKNSTIISKKKIKENKLELNDFLIKSSGKKDNKVKIEFLGEEFLDSFNFIDKIKTTYIDRLNEKYKDKNITFQYNYN